MKFKTLAIHSGQEPDKNTGAVITPVYQTSTFKQHSIGVNTGYEYSRTGNPTRKALEDVIASLEGGKYGLAFSSGSAATSAVFHLLNPGDHVILGDDVYGGTYRLIDKVFKKYGIIAEYAVIDDISSYQKLVRKETKLIWVETPSNPLLKIADIESLSMLSRANEIILAVDNTFASPYFQNPLKLRADIVVHSTTKYISGHSDTIGGAIVTSDEKIYQNLKFHQNAEGAVPGLWECWLALRGIKTLAVRMEEHNKNAKTIAEYLEKHPLIDKVYYPGLPSHSQYELARKQMSGFGGMISIEIRGGYNTVEKFVDNLKIFILAESLGGVESLISHPEKMTHASMSPEERLHRGIKDNLLRLSVGIEDVDDLLGDIKQALDNI